MAPSSRLVLLAVLVALPAATVAGFVPALTIPAWTILLATAAIAAVDAVRGAALAGSITARAPEIVRLTKDVAGSFSIILSNRSGGPQSVRVAVELPETLSSEKLIQEVEVPAGDSQLTWPVVARERGEYPLAGMQLELLSPFGLWTVRARRPVRGSFRVYPNLRDKATASLFLRTADVGMRRRPRIGKGREFENLRHYMSGDNYEDIHWKATARRGVPVVKLYQVEHAQEVYAIIDSSRLSAREGILESYVNAALHLALVAQSQGDRFGLVTFSNRTHRFVRARSGLGHFRLCRETIYNLRAERVSPDFREVFTTLQLNLRRRALLVFFTSLDDALLAETFAQEVPLVARRHLVLVNVTDTPDMRSLFEGDPPADLAGLYRGLAGQMLRNRMREVQIALGNKGVKLTLVDPDRIKLQVTSQYLEVKRRQVL